MLTDDDVDAVTDLSTDVLELLKTRTTPANAALALTVTLARLAAMQAFPGTTDNEAWQAMTDEPMRALFLDVFAKCRRTS